MSYHSAEAQKLWQRITCPVLIADPIRDATDSVLVEAGIDKNKYLDVHRYVSSALTTRQEELNRWRALKLATKWKSILFNRRKRELVKELKELQKSGQIS
jgi:hypothetical protein